MYDQRDEVQKSLSTGDMFPSFVMIKECLYWKAIREVHVRMLGYLCVTSYIWHLYPLSKASEKKIFSIELFVVGLIETPPMSTHNMYIGTQA